MSEDYSVEATTRFIVRHLAVALCTATAIIAGSCYAQQRSADAARVDQAKVNATPLAVDYAKAEAEKATQEANRAMWEHTVSK